MASDEELLAARAKRTGRKNTGVPLDQTGVSNQRHPGQDNESRSPLDGFEADPSVDNDDGVDHTPRQPQPNDTQNQLNAAIGRLQPLQQQLADREAALVAVQHQLAEARAAASKYEQAEREAIARRAADEFDPFAGIPPEDLELMDPIVRNTILASTRATMKAFGSRFRDPEEVVRQTMAAQDKLRRDALVQTTNQDLGLVDLSRDPKFEAFINEDDSAGLLLQNYINAPDARSAEILIPRVRAMVKRYQSNAKTPDPRNPDPADALAAHSRRGSNRPSDSAGGTRGAQLSPAQAKDIRLKATAAIRAGRKDEANRLMQQLN